MRRIALALPILFVAGSQDGTAPGDVLAAQQAVAAIGGNGGNSELLSGALTASSLAGPSPITITCTASFPPRCEVKIKRP